MVKCLNEGLQFDADEFVRKCAGIAAALEGIRDDDVYDYIDDLNSEDADTVARNLQYIIRLCGDIADSFGVDLIV